MSILAPYTAYEAISGAYRQHPKSAILKSISITAELGTCPLRIANASSIDCRDKEDIR
jgi:hypothetical protein